MSDYEHDTELGEGRMQRANGVWSAALAQDFVGTEHEEDIITHIYVSGREAASKAGYLAEWTDGWNSVEVSTDTDLGLVNDPEPRPQHTDVRCDACDSVLEVVPICNECAYKPFVWGE